MTYAQIRQRATFLAMLAGWDGIAPAADWSALVNRAVEDFSWDSEYNIETTTFSTVINQATYALAAPAWKYLSDVVIGTDQPMLLSSEAFERQRDPLWLVRPMGVPERYWMPAPATLQLYPIPSSVQTVTMRGVREAAALVNDSDVPAFPATWHEALALRAAILHCLPWCHDELPGATEQMPRASGSQKLDAYRDLYVGMVNECMRWRAAANAPIQRHVKPRLPERATLSGSVRGIL